MDSANNFDGVCLFLFFPRFRRVGNLNSQFRRIYRYVSIPERTFLRDFSLSRDTLDNTEESRPAYPEQHS